MPTCTNCHREFSKTSNLTRHLQRCKSRETFQHSLELQTQREQYEREFQTQRERELQTQREHYERELQTQREQYERELQTQRELNRSQSERITRLENQIFEIAKQPKNNTNHNIHHQNTVTTKINTRTNISIINQLAPYDLNTDKITAILTEHFTPEVFKRGPQAIAQVIAEHILIDPDTKKPRMVCTDQERRNFKYIDSVTGKLVVDPGFTKTHDLMRKPLVEVTWDIWDRHLERSNWWEDTTLDNNRFIRNTRQLSGSLLQYLHVNTSGTVKALPGEETSEE